MNAPLREARALRTEIGAQEPVTFIDAGGTRLAAMRRGHGIPVVCLHAIVHGARDFEDLAARIGNGFEVIALDWPGQGRSPFDGVPPDAAHYAKLAGAAIDALCLERPILLGNSIGGAAALRLAASAPDKLRALVLCNNGGLTKVGPITRFLIGRFVAFFRAGENRKRWFGPAFRVYYGRVLKEKPARAQRDRIAASAYETAYLLRQAWEGFARRDADIRALAARVTCPVWMAWAKNDAILSWSGVRRAVRKFPRHRVTFFRGGHSAFLEDPERFEEAFRAFVKACVT